MPFPAAFLQMYFPGDWRSEAASEGRKNFLLPVRRAALRCCSSGIVSPRLRGGNFGASVGFFCSRERRWDAPASQAVGVRLGMKEPGRILEGGGGGKRADLPPHFPAPLGDALQKPTTLLFSGSGWRCCLRVLSRRLRFPLPKGLYSIFPPRFPPTFLHPLPRTKLCCSGRQPPRVAGHGWWGGGRRRRPEPGGL